MKLYLLLLALISGSCCTSIKIGDLALKSEPAPRDWIEDLVKALAEILKETIPDVIPIGSFPPLSINEALLKIDMELTNLEFVGANKFNIPRVTTNIIFLDAEMDINFDEPLILQGQYKIDGTFGIIFPIFGEGAFSIEIHELGVMGGGRILLLPPSIYRLRYDILSFKELVTSFEGLVGGELGEVIGEIIGDLGLAIFNYIEPLIHDNVVKILTDLINWIISSGLVPPIPEEAYAKMA